MQFNRFIEINENKIGEEQAPYIIAEMACAHDGTFEKAIHLVNAAHSAGANAVQLQFFVPEHTVTPQHEVFSILKKIEFSKDQWTQIFEKGKALGLDVWICTYDAPSVQLAEQLGADGIKLNSADLSNPEILAAVSKTKIPFTLGTGASTIEEIRSGLDIAAQNGAKDIVLMHGVQNFPTDVPNLNIARINLLKREFPRVPVGYADHTNADDPFSKIVDLVALGFGACLIEKHITLNRSEKGIDYQAALEPHEFKLWVETLRKAHLAIGTSDVKPFSESDLKYRKFQKKSIVAARDISAAETINRNAVQFLRNSQPGLPPTFLNEILSKKSRRAIKRFENINLEDLE